MFAGQEDGGQALAAAAAVRERFAVVAGGPGTGKTTTVARIVALLAEQAAAAGAPAPLVALAAPTGKAAARLEEAVHDEARGARRRARGARAAAGAAGVDAAPAARLAARAPTAASATTAPTGCPHDVVVVDETSMVSLSLMARLVEAVRPEARLVLVGDPGQLTSIEAGAVLGDIVGPADARAADAARRARRARGRHAARRSPRPTRRRRPGSATGSSCSSASTATAGGSRGSPRRSARGDADARSPCSRRRRRASRGCPTTPPRPATPRRCAPAPSPPGARRSPPRPAGDAAAALAALAEFRLLCAHRRGPYGAATWIGASRAGSPRSCAGFGAAGEWYAGRPLLVTENDYGLRLYNGDTGVVVADGPERLAAAFERRGGVTLVSPARLGAVETVHAMTIHKSQGSQFGTAAVLLPPPTSPILTRELLYTGGHPRARARDPRRHRGGAARRDRPAGRARLGPARLAVGRSARPADAVGEHSRAPKPRSSYLSSA